MLPTTRMLQASSAEDRFQAALAMLHTGQGNPMAAADALLKDHPGFAPAHCLRLALLVMTAREDALADLARAVGDARATQEGTDEQSRRHVEAAAAWLAGDLHRALEAYGSIVADHPTDTLALRVAHFGDLQWGRTEHLRDRVAAVLPHWAPDMPGYGHVLGMHAFGLAEAGDLVLAEQVGRSALAFTPDHAGAIHAVAHALEMQGRAADGIGWLEQTAAQWDGSSYATHLWWYLALFYLDLGNTGAALSILDWRMRADRGSAAATLVDATSLLWRLELCGVAPGRRWETVARAWRARPLDGLRPFNDTHAVLAFVGARRLPDAVGLIKDLRACAARCRDLETVVYQAALPVCDAFIRFGRGDYRGATSRLLRHRRLASRCGGSRAQCDLLHLTLLEAAMRSGREDLAGELAVERTHLRPHSRMNAWLLQRVEGAARVPRVA